MKYEEPDSFSSEKKGRQHGPAPRHRRPLQRHGGVLVGAREHDHKAGRDDDCRAARFSRSGNSPFMQEVERSRDHRIIDPDKRGGAAEGDDDLLGGAYQERDLRIGVPLETSISSLYQDVERDDEKIDRFQIPSEWRLWGGWGK